MKPSALRTALLRGKRRPRNGGGGSPTQFRGDGLEFVEVRAYADGDDPRRIDWASSARVGQLQTRVVLEDVSLTLAVIVDVSSSMFLGRISSLASAASEAMTTWFGCTTGEDRCVRVGSSSLLTPAHLRGRNAAVAAAAATDAAPFSLERALITALAALPRGSAVLVVSDFWEPPDRDLMARCARRFDMTALVARDPWFDGIPLRGFVRLRDVETGEQSRLFVDAAARRKYAEATQQRERELHALLRSVGWRTEALLEGAGSRSLYAAFGLAERIA